MLTFFHTSVGKLIFPRGLGIYDGDWSRGKMHGKGSRSYSNGSKYIGSFRDGEPHGEGICMYVNGDQYIGEWASGFQTGRGNSVHIKRNWKSQESVFPHLSSFYDIYLYRGNEVRIRRYI